METVTIDGLQYVKAAVLAKKYKYTSDYIGQLCRGKKVDAHLVGRTWYVNQKSLDSHKDTRYLELRSNDKISKIKTNIVKSRIEIPATVAKSTIKRLRHYEDRVTWKPTAYENDDTNLLPALTRNSSHKLAIDLADGTPLEVDSLSKNTAMTAVHLPAISLSGTLRVQNYEAAIDLEGGDDTIGKPSHDGSYEPTYENHGAEGGEDFGSNGSAKNEVRLIHPAKVTGAAVKVKLHRSAVAKSTTHIDSESSDAREVAHHQINNRLIHPGREVFHHKKLPVKEPVRLVALEPLRVTRGPVHVLQIIALPVLLACFGTIAFSLLATETVVTVNSIGDASSSLRYSATIFQALQGLIF